MDKKKRLPCLLLIFLIAPAVFPQSSADSRIEIYNLRHHTHPSFTRIVIDVGGLREYFFDELRSPDRVYVDVFQAKLNPILHTKTVSLNNDYIHEIRIAQKNHTTVRTAVDLDFSKIDHYRVWHLPDPFRIIIDIYPTKNTSAPLPTDAGYSMARQLGLGIKRIVIDPGHGGKDPGCIGSRYTQEKAIVLDIAKRLKNLLSTHQELEVIMTRETDIFVPVENRPVIANQKKADLFISIHANANPRKSYSGTATFFLNFSTDPSVNAIAARENATSTKSIGDMKEIITKIAQNSKITESKELAENIQNNLTSNLKKSYKYTKDLGVKGGPFWVLIGGDMPSVLVETLHMSNSREEALLRSDDYRQKIAHGIYQGIVQYMQSLGKG
ncbi:MAG: AMIN domain-containing protein [Candidatus Aminicenantes bacterium]|nr:AMIN domain-containing protein [Candidatus Aminicenantes bacterium]